MTTSNRTAAYTAGPPENSTTTGDANRAQASLDRKGDLISSSAHEHE
jgi:hypothetical protein